MKSLYLSLTRNDSLLSLSHHNIIQSKNVPWKPTDFMAPQWRNRNQKRRGKTAAHFQLLPPVVWQSPSAWTLRTTNPPTDVGMGHHPDWHPVQQEVLHDVAKNAARVSWMLGRAKSKGWNWWKTSALSCTQNTKRFRLHEPMWKTSWIQEAFEVSRRSYSDHWSLTTFQAALSALNMLMSRFLPCAQVISHSSNESHFAWTAHWICAQLHRSMTYL